MKRKPSGGKAASRRSRKKGASPQHSINTQTHPDAAGIKVGAEEFGVAAWRRRDVWIRSNEGVAMAGNTRL